MPEQASGPPQIGGNMLITSNPATTTTFGITTIALAITDASVITEEREAVS